MGIFPVYIFIVCEMHTDIMTESSDGMADV